MCMSHFYKRNELSLPAAPCPAPHAPARQRYLLRYRHSSPHCGPAGPQVSDLPPATLLTPAQHSSPMPIKSDSAQPQRHRTSETWPAIWRRVVERRLAAAAIPMCTQSPSGTPETSDPACLRTCMASKGRTPVLASRSIGGGRHITPEVTQLFFLFFSPGTKET
jgi:hypothetical protein